MKKKSNSFTKKRQLKTNASIWEEWYRVSRVFTEFHGMNHLKEKKRVVLEIELERFWRTQVIRTYDRGVRLGSSARRKPRSVFLDEADASDASDASVDDLERFSRALADEEQRLRQREASYTSSSYTTTSSSSTTTTTTTTTSSSSSSRVDPPPADDAVDAAPSTAGAAPRAGDAR